MEGLKEFDRLAENLLEWTEKLEGHGGFAVPRSSNIDQLKTHFEHVKVGSYSQSEEEQTLLFCDLFTYLQRCVKFSTCVCRLNLVNTVGKISTANGSPGFSPRPTLSRLSSLPTFYRGLREPTHLSKRVGYSRGCGLLTEFSVVLYVDLDAILTSYANLDGPV